jgi:hypothetical protein
MARRLVPPVRSAVMFWVTRRPAGKARRGRILGGDKACQYLGEHPELA